MCKISGDGDRSAIIPAHPDRPAGHGDVNVDENLLERRADPAETCGSRWDLSVEHTSISFEARWLFGMLTVTGAFTPASGWVVLTPSGDLFGEIVADATTIATGNRLRDRHLQNRFFFDSANYPVAVFGSIVCNVQDGRVDGVGFLSVRRRTAKVRALGALLCDGNRMRLAGNAVLDTRDFGLPSAWGYIRREVIVSVDAWLDREPSSNG